MTREQVLELYEKVVATLKPAVELKGDTMPYTSLNGHMFSVLHKDASLALRLPPDAREPFLRKHKTTLSKQYGMVQPEYVVVPADLLARTSELKAYFAASYAYVAAMKPKPTTKPKKAAGAKAKKARPAPRKSR